MPVKTADGEAAGPYPGLRPFLPSERDIFFGREQMIDEVLVRLNERHMVVVHGASGCGKSSLVAAGVLPHLEHRRARRGLELRTESFRPENRPMQNLVHTLSLLCRGGDGRSDIEAVYRTLSRRREARALLAAEAKARGIDQVCIVIDQFEELFRFAEEQGYEQAAHFCETLVKLADVGGTQPQWWEEVDEKPQADEADAEISFILTMRSEFLGDCSRYPGLAEIVNRTQYLLPNMDRGDLIRAIREPIEIFGGLVEHRLAERIADDASREQDPLPLVQHALLQLWRNSSVGRLTLADYDSAIGNVDDEQSSSRSPLGTILARHADQVLADATGDNTSRLAAAEFIFRSLSKKDSESRVIRCPQKFGRLVQLSGLSEDETREVVDAFRSEGVSFLTPYQGVQPNIDADTMIDISHEALIRAWPRMSDRSIDLETARPIGWAEREAQDGMLWRWLAVQAEFFQSNSRAYLDGSTSERLTKWFAAIKVRPEWARRHLLHSTNEIDITREPEWLAVEHLLSESQRKSWFDRKMLKRWRKLSWYMIALLVVLIVGAAANYFVVGPILQRRWELEEAREAAANRAAATDQVVRRTSQQQAANRPSAQSERVDPRLAETASAGNVGPVLVSNAQTGFIWIGTRHPDDRIVSNIMQPNRRRVSPDRVQPSAELLVVDNTVVRGRFPTRGRYVPAASIGLITALSPIRVVGQRREYSVDGRTEYWVEARLAPPQAFPTVWLRITNDANRAADRLRASLMGIGYLVTEAELTDNAIGRAEVVYCHEGDRPAAVRLATTASRALNGTGVANSVIAPIRGADCGETDPPGTISLILDLSPAEPAAQSMPSDAAATG